MLFISKINTFDVNAAGVEGSGLVPWVGGPPDASFGLYRREADQRRKDTLQQDLLGTDML